MKVKVSELDGLALDWVVAQVKGLKPSVMNRHWRTGKPYLCCDTMENDLPEWSPSTIWEQGGYLISEHSLEIINIAGGFACIRDWDRDSELPCIFSMWPSGQTHLVAACRAIISKVMGDSVDVPDDIFQRK